jgi:hypothetical protein
MSTIKTVCDVTVAGLVDIAASCSSRSSESTGIAPAGAHPPFGEAKLFHDVISCRHVSSVMYTTLLCVNFQRGRPSGPG